MARKVQQLTPGQEFLLSLERERFNVAYRVPAEQPKIEVREVIRWVAKPCQKQHFDAVGQEDRDSMLFNAGRYAAGARDTVAIVCHDQLMKELES